ncbi:MAG: phytanoyl-CoA dioxygenase, partial [Streptomyces sp.]|nr:phytanoyl-CoA dioxygenase [Streptomyces sp.]
MSPASVRSAVRLTERDCDLDAFRALVERRTDPAGHPHASAIERGVPVYDADRLDDAEAELVHTLADGPGVLVVRGAFPDRAVVDRATAVFDALIEAQRASGTVAGDHFAAPGANDRVWNALEKTARHDPEAFA